MFLCRNVWVFITLLSFHSWKRRQVFKSVSASTLDFSLELHEATCYHTELSIQLIKCRGFAMRYSYTETLQPGISVTVLPFFPHCLQYLKKTKLFFVLHLLCINSLQLLFDFSLI